MANVTKETVILPRFRGQSHSIAKAGFVDVKLCNWKNEFKYRQRFVYGAVPSIESTTPLKIKYRFGWIAKRSIRKVP